MQESRPPIGDAGGPPTGRTNAGAQPPDLHSSGSTAQGEGHALSAEPCLGLSKIGSPSKRITLWDAIKPTSLPAGLHRHSQALGEPPDMHGRVQMFMPGGGGRKCAAASHTSRPVPTLDGVSDVAHCAQNFGQNAKLTISLSNTRRGRMAIAEDGRMATNMKPAGIGGRGIEPSRHRQAMSLSRWRGLSPASFRGREIRPGHDTVADSRVFRLGRWGNQNKPVISR